MTDQSGDTKLKIMRTARILFAENGFEGSSIRDIAKIADVNVASVNYHFSSKENLFSEVLRLGYIEGSQEMRRFYDERSPSVEESLLHLFHYFMGKPHDIIIFFKMMMTRQHSHNMVSQGSDDQQVGPPGGKVIIEAITKEVDGVIPEQDLHWALKSLFGHVVHNSIMYTCCFKDNDIPYTSMEDLESNIKRLSRVVVKELKSLK